MDVMLSGNEYDDEPVSIDMLEDICDGIQSHTIIIRRNAYNKIYYRIKQSQAEWK